MHVFMPGDRCVFLKLCLACAVHCPSLSILIRTSADVSCEGWQELYIVQSPASNTHDQQWVDKKIHSVIGHQRYLQEYQPPPCILDHISSSF